MSMTRKVILLACGFLLLAPLQVAAGEFCQPEAYSNGNGGFNCKISEHRKSWNPYPSESKCEASCGNKARQSGGAGASGGPSSAYPYGDTIVVDSAPNTEWSSAFAAGNYSSAQVYTDIIVDLDDAFLQRNTYTCADFNLGRAFLQRIFGTNTSMEQRLSLLISDGNILGSDFTISNEARGFAIPLFKVAKTSSDSCKITRVVSDNHRIARVRAEQGESLRVLVAYHQSEDFRPVSNLADTSGTGFISTLVNGRLTDYGAALVTSLGVNLVRNTELNLADEREISVYPSAGKNEKLTYTIVVGGTPLLKFDVLQDPVISRDGNMHDRRSVTNALGQTFVISKSNGVFIGKRTLRSFLGALTPTDNAVRSDVNKLADMCGLVEAKLDEVFMSSDAKERFFALMMAEFKSPNLLNGNNICLTEQERKNHLDILSTVITGLKPEFSGTCKNSTDWITQHVNRAAVFLGDDGQTLSDHRRLKAGPFFATRQNLNRSASLLASAAETSNSGAACFFAQNVPSAGNPECRYLFLTADENKSFWVAANIKEVLSENGGRARPTYGDFVLDVSLASYLTKEAGLSHHDGICRRAVTANFDDAAKQ